MKTLISQLYEALHVQEHQLLKERELCTHLETLQQQVLPMEDVRVLFVYVGAYNLEAGLIIYRALW